MSSINSNPFGFITTSPTSNTTAAQQAAPTATYSGFVTSSGPVGPVGPVGIPGPLGTAGQYGFYEEDLRFPARPNPHTFQIFNNKGQLVVMIDHFGGIIFGAGAASWDQAARSFWEAMISFNPMCFENNVLKEHRRDLVQAVLQLNKQLAELSDENAKLKEKLRNGQT